MHCPARSRRVQGSRGAQLVLARIIEPVSKLDSPRVLEEAGATAASYRTVTRWLRAYATDTWRNKRPQVETRVLEVERPQAWRACCIATWRAAGAAR